MAEYRHWLEEVMLQCYTLILCCYSNNLPVHIRLQQHYTTYLYQLLENKGNGYHYTLIMIHIPDLSLQNIYFYSELA